jgi:hypothetical protein
MRPMTREAIVPTVIPTYEQKLAAQQQGAAFEIQFAVHMTRDLGFAEAKVNQFLRGKTATRPYQVDVVGVKKQLLWRLIYAISALVVLAGLLTLAVPTAVPRVTKTVTAAGAKVQKATGLTSVGAGIAAIGAVAFIFAAMGDRNSRKRVWVECKARKARIKRADITKTVSSVEDVRAYAGRRRVDAVDEIWFVSTVEYDCDALSLARDKCVVLFSAVGGVDGVRFERVD